MLDPIELWRVRAATGPGSDQGPLIIIALLLFAVVLSNSRRNRGAEKGKGVMETEKQTRSLFDRIAAVLEKPLPDPWGTIASAIVLFGVVYAMLYLLAVIEVWAETRNILVVEKFYRLFNNTHFGVFQQ